MEFIMQGNLHISLSLVLKKRSMRYVFIIIIIILKFLLIKAIFLNIYNLIQFTLKL